MAKFQLHVPHIEFRKGSCVSGTVSSFLTYFFTFYIHLSPFNNLFMLMTLRKKSVISLHFMGVSVHQ
jgi:hypothetical protein